MILKYFADFFEKQFKYMNLKLDLIVCLAENDVMQTPHNFQIYEN